MDQHLSIPRGSDSPEVTILLVDDERLLLDAAARLLERAGFCVLTAATPEEALKLWEAHKEAIRGLVVDNELNAEMTGMQLAERLSGEKPSLKTILLSGYPLNAGNRGWKEAIFFQKPCDGHALVDVLRAHLTK